MKKASINHRDKQITLYEGDLPPGYESASSVAVDTEAMGLRFRGRDRLCLVQVYNGEGEVYLVRVKKGQKEAPRLQSLLRDSSVTKIFHFARFDIGILYETFGVLCQSVYCTKIASRLARTYTDRHSLKDLCRTLLGVDISKKQQDSDWGREEITSEQMIYAACDVLHLHDLVLVLDEMLHRESRVHFVKAAFDFLPYRSLLDVAGWEEEDIFSHTTR